MKITEHGAGGREPHINRIEVAVTPPTDGWDEGDAIIVYLKNSGSDRTDLAAIRCEFTAEDL